MCMPILCCCLGGVCNLCCCKIPCTGSRSTRITYAIGLLLVTIAAWILRNWGNEIIPASWQKCSGDCFNYLGVYRISMGFVLYHTFLCLFTIGITTSRYFRAKFHNGWWPVKIILMVGLIVACFFVPESFFNDYAIIAITGGIIFLIIQTILILDFAYMWAESWVQYYEEDHDPCWQFLLIGATIICYAIVIAVSVLLYVYYANGPYQAINIFFITFNLVLVLIFSIVSVLPSVQEANPKSGILQAAIIGAYSTYVVASAISSEPTSTGDCQPSSADVFSQLLFYIGFATTFLALCISSFTASTEEAAFSGSSEDLDDEKDGIKYKYYFLHIVYLLAGFYMAVLLTNWATFASGSFDGGDFCVGEGIASTWAKMATSWLISVLYLWTLVAPILMPERFGN